MLKNPEKTPNIEKLEWQTHNFFVKIITPLFADCKTVGQTGIFPKDDPVSDKFIKNQLSTDFISQSADSSPDMLFTLSDEEDKNASQDEVAPKEKPKFLIVDLSEKRTDFDVVEYVNHFSVILRHYFKDSELYPYVWFTILFGPKVAPFSMKSFGGCFTFTPITIFLSETDKDKLLMELERKISSNEKASPMDFICLTQLPGIGKFDKNLYEKCLSLINNPTLGHEMIARGLLRYMDLIYGKL
jgi:hypothetical protein